MADALAPCGDDVYRVHQRRPGRRPTLLAGLFEWLPSRDFDEDRVLVCMSVQHSY